MSGVDDFEALFRGLGELKDGLTVDELALRTGRNRKWIMEKLHLVAAAERLVIGKKPGLDIRTGKTVMVTCYKIASAKPRARR